MLERSRWSTDLDPVSKEIAIVEQGSPGKVFVPKHGPRGEYREVYGLITVLPSSDNPSEARTTVVFSGLTSAGAHGAAAYFTDPGNLAALQQRFQQEGLGRWPRSFQVLVRCTVSEDTQLLTYAYESHTVAAQ